MRLSRTKIEYLSDRILRLMQEINEQEGTTFIFSTHDPRVIDMAGRVLNICDGEIADV